ALLYVFQYSATITTPVQYIIKSNRKGTPPQEFLKRLGSKLRCPLFTSLGLSFKICFRAHIPQSTRCPMFFITVRIAGTTVLIAILGKIKSTSGGTSLIVVFAALSSAGCLRCVRGASEKFPRDFDKGVPNRSV